MQESPIYGINVIFFFLVFRLLYVSMFVSVFSDVPCSSWCQAFVTVSVSALMSHYADSHAGVLPKEYERLLPNDQNCLICPGLITPLSLN